MFTQMHKTENMEYLLEMSNSHYGHIMTLSILSSISHINSPVPAQRKARETTIVCPSQMATFMSAQ